MSWINLFWILSQVWNRSDVKVRRRSRKYNTHASLRSRSDSACSSWCMSGSVLIGADDLLGVARTQTGLDIIGYLQGNLTPQRTLRITPNSDVLPNDSTLIKTQRLR